MRNSAAKRIIAVLLCLVVFAGSELTGLTNIVGDLFAEETTTGTDDSDRDNVVEDVEVEAQSEESQEDTEEAVEEEPEEDPEPQAEEDTTEETVEPETEEPQEPQEIEADGEDDVTEEENKESDTDPADTEDDGVSKEPVADKEDKADTEDEKTEENNVAEETDKTQEDAAVVDDAKLPAGEEQPAASETVTDPAEENKTEQKLEDEEEPEAFEEEYQDGQVVIHVAADPGVVPNGTELSVKKIVQQDVETLDDEEEIKEAEELNAKYEGIKSELELTVADDDTKEIAGFVAYDVNFLLTDEDGETTEIEPDGEVSVSMEFEEAYLPEEIAEKEDQIEIDRIDVIHMEEAEEDEESETGLKSEVVADADVSTTENAVEKAEFTTDSGRTFVITWTENDLGEREYVCETEDATIKVTAAKGVVPDGALLKVVPILANNEATQKQYQDVEKKLLEKAETEKYEIAGFLAYDISFTDEAGAKLEPNGEVKVAINYKKAAIPEDLKDLASTTYALDDTEGAAEKDTEQAEFARTTEEKAAEETGTEDETSRSDASQSETPAATGNITVMHLEENDQGQVTKVVDMGAEGKVTELNSTKDQKVTSTEFVTESFSTFTIVWTYGLGTKNISIMFWDADTDAEIVLNEELGNLTNSIKLIYDPNNEKSGQFNVSDIKNGGNRSEYYQITDRNGNVYTFNKAVCRGPSETEYPILGFGYNEYGNFCFIDATNEPIVLEDYQMNSMTFLFLYTKEESGGELEGVPTVDNNDYGITMRMIDYGDTDFEAGKKIQAQYLGDAGGWKGGNLTQRIVKNRLENGYPVTSNDVSLKPLFDEISDGFDIKSQEVNHLFRKDIYDTTGYFQYSCFENYAYLDKNNNFILYEGGGTPGDYNDVKYGEEVLFYKRGNFLPYNPVEKGQYSTEYRNLYDENGKKLKEGDLGYNDPLYKPVADESDKKNAINYSFGMYMEAAFSQPEGGQVGKSDMIYRFNGDDDLWLFIDDTLILDIGGSHDARSGTINFANGNVHIEQDDIGDTTIKALFREAGFFPDGKPWAEEEAGKYFKDNTFSDYSTHTIKMFYMERGGAASNLKISMNLPTVQKRTVEVEKQLSTDKWKYKDVEFAFQVLAEKTEDKLSEGEEVETVNGKEYVILNHPYNKKTQEDISVTNIEEGGKEYKNVFYLKPGEVAQFRDLDENREYFVREIGLKADEYNHVTIRGTSVDEGTIQNGVVESGIYKVGEWPRVVYLNECADANSNELHIKKVMSDESVPTDTFAFKVTLGRKDFTDPYYLKTNDNAEWREMPAPTDGIIRGVLANDTIKIDNLLTGTQFKVEEIELNGEKYTLSNMVGSNVTNGVYNSENSSFTGTIASDKDAIITVTNSPKGVADGGITITKQLQAGSPEDTMPFEFEVSLTDKEGKSVNFTEYTVGDTTKQVNNGKIEITAGSMATIKAPTAVGFEVKEILREGYDTPKIVVNGQELSGLTDPLTATGDIAEGKYASIVFTNIPKPTYTWEIVKQSSSGNQPLGEAEFELKSGDGKTTYYGLSDKDAGGVVKWYANSEDAKDKKNEITNISERLVAGDYTLTEVKAPEGFIKVLGSWTITILDKDVPTIKGESDQAKAALGESGGDDTKAIFYIRNDVIPYELPSTGGAGIFGYMISGVLLMMAGVLVLYKRKYAGRC